VTLAPIGANRVHYVFGGGGVSRGVLTRARWKRQRALVYAPWMLAAPQRNLPVDTG
jgi:hypothetical protein